MALTNEERDAILEAKDVTWKGGGDWGSKSRR